MTWQIGDRVWIGTLKSKRETELYGNRHGEVILISPFTIPQNTICVRFDTGRQVWFQPDELQPAQQEEGAA